MLGVGKAAPPPRFCLRKTLVRRKRAAAQKGRSSSVPAPVPDSRHRGFLLSLDRTAAPELPQAI